MNDDTLREELARLIFHHRQDETGSAEAWDLADAILVSDLIKAVRREVAEEIVAAIEDRRPHIPVSTDSKRRERVVERSTLNRAARIAREVGEVT